MLNPNPPRMITVVVAVALILVGMSATIFPLDFVNAALDVVQDALGTNIQVTEQYGYLFMFAGDALLARAACCRASEMGGRLNFAPRMPTISVALVLILVGLLGTFVAALPDLAGSVARPSAPGRWWSVGSSCCWG